jgi:hypothetical protein
MPWNPADIAALTEKYKLTPYASIVEGSENHHFPEPSFLRSGYAPISGYVKDFCMLRHDGRWHLFHINGYPNIRCWASGNEIAFGHASTTDFQHWLRHYMPLAVGVEPWESSHIWAPYVYPRDGRFYMFYMGSGPAGAFISYATSTDLESWTRWPGGPIRAAVGRDPFVFEHEGKTVLAYTGHKTAHVAACVSSDMQTWEPIQPMITIDGGAAAESASMHPCMGRYVLWFNDYRTQLAGFRAAYAFSDDPMRFDQRDIHTFDFQTDTPGAAPSPELRPPGAAPNSNLGPSKPIPLSIELIAARDPIFFVAYVRWQGDRNRLFFGELDWSEHPAVLREINTEEHLHAVLRNVGLMNG